MPPVTASLLRLLPCLLLAALAAPPAALADGAIYGFVDEDGVERYSNVPDDARYRVILDDRLRPAATALRAPRGVFALPPDARPHHAAVLAASRATGIEAALLHAVIAVESGYRHDAVSAQGATGLMQLMPGTARRYGLADARDPAANVGAGARYLRDLLALFGNDLRLALAAYNAGENAVLRAGRRIPPYAETQRYVPLVLAHYERLRRTVRADRA